MNYKLICGDALDVLKKGREKSIQTCITSPPYFGLRKYGGGEQEIGIEKSPDEYIQNLVEVFREVRRVLRDDGTLWIVIGDSYAGGNYRGGGLDTANKKQRSNSGTHDFMQKSPPPIPVGCKPKDLIGIPWMLAFALRADGWWLRSAIAWCKGNPMPESVTDRPTKATEQIFLLTKSKTYYYDAVAIAEPAIHAGKFARNGGADGMDEGYDGHRTREGLREGLTVASTRNKRDWWEVNAKPFRGAHFAVFPEKLVEPMVLAGSKEGDWILDPFCGAATTLVVALKHNRRCIGIDLNPEYIEMSRARIEKSLSENPQKGTRT